MNRTFVLVTIPHRLQRERNILESKKLQIEKNQQERAANEEKKAGLEAKVTETDFIIAQISTRSDHLISFLFLFGFI